ncbi:MAG: zinc-binding dehydrogenase [Acetobacteraceae bacterium]
MKQSIPQTRPEQIALNPAIIGLAKRSETTISGSLYAAPPARRHEVARALAQAHCWIHADMFSPEAKGVRLAETDRILAEGLGPVDVHLLSDQAMGASHIIVTDMQADRRQRALQFGATRVIDPLKESLDLLGVDTFIDCSGATPAIKSGIKAVRPAGYVVLVGMGADELPIPSPSFRRGKSG